MALLTTVDDIIARISNNYDKTVHLHANSAVTRSALFSGAANPAFMRGAFVRSLPGSFETGVTGYLPTEVNMVGSANTQGGLGILAELIDLGSIDISGASGTFTDGSTMPTRTELGASNVIASPVWCEVETALNSNAGNITITYTDQDGNTSQSTGAQTITNSSAVQSGGFLPLASGDWGVRDITAASRAAGSSPTGVIRFWGVIPISSINITPSGIATVEDCINSGMIRRLSTAGAKLGVLYNASSLAAAGIFGSIRFVGDA